MPDAWTLELDGWNPADEGRREALCTLGNGRFATRGAAPEAPADGVHYPGTYAAGVLQPAAATRSAGGSIENESIVNLPDWLPLTLPRSRTATGSTAAASTVLDYAQELDLRRGRADPPVPRSGTPRGRRTAVAQRRFVHHGRPAPGRAETRVHRRELVGPARVVRSGIDGRVANSGVARYRDSATGI